MGAQGWNRVTGGQPQVGENLGNYPGIFDGGDDRHGAATVRTVCQIDLEHPFMQLAEIQAYLDANPLDDYDRLFQLGHSIALPQRFCLLETRWVDVLIRYENYNEFTIPKWKAFDEIKAYFGQIVGKSIYH